MSHTASLLRMLALGSAMLCVSCEKDSSLAPRKSCGPEAAASANGEGTGAYTAKNYFQVGMCTCLTGLTQAIDMTQSNYVETPNGNRTSVWTGPVAAALMPPLTLNPTTGVAAFTYLSYWNRDADGVYYDSECVVVADGTGGGIATLTLHAKKAKK
ncbi:hypothetical protein LGH70_20760 [Hymenobacter sp. BT635]|uniref:Lipoprotein n=1 Tax=Hymenobacter nitidus TaxID=2880929 RepID=A0ABS8AHX6_9BACT|nr:hypothetical protein [Hymenobacter nitidus]MCB2380038.1 hypothetical protein [Hymenobacter nitidus]